MRWGREGIIRDAVENNGRCLSPREQEKAVVIAKENWQGNTGLGQAVQSAVNSVKKLRD